MIGIDPGLKGAVAWYPGGDSLPCSWPFETEGDTIRLLRELKEDIGEQVIYMEALHALPNKIRPAVASWKLGENYGLYKGIAQCLRYRLELVTAQKWQKHFGGGFKGSKTKLRERARQVVPALGSLGKHKVVSTVNSDALLIAKYGHETERTT